MSDSEALPDGAFTAPAALRNRDPILDALRPVLPRSGTILEIASGSGEHAVHFARHLRRLQFQPSDPSPDARHSIAARAKAAGLPNLNPPIALDAMDAEWPVGEVCAILAINMDSNSCVSANSTAYRKFDACVCINMVHISPWDATVGLFKGCAQALTDEAPIILYGPYLEGGVETAASNLAFDDSLKARNPAWGLRHLDEVDRVASEHGFTRISRYEMPANNLMLVYRRRSA